jgi:hypothetical protein
MALGFLEFFLRIGAVNIQTAKKMWLAFPGAKPLVQRRLDLTHPNVSAEPGKRPEKALEFPVGAY